MIIKVLDRKERYLRNIEAWDVRRRQVINGDHTLEFETQDMGVEEGHRIIYREQVTNRWREFIVTDIDDIHDKNGISKLIYAEDSFYETIGDWIDDRRMNNTTATVALQAALDTTRWEVGQVDDLGLASTNYYRENPKEAVQKKLLKAWGGEFDTRVEVVGNVITHRYVDLRAQLGASLGKRFVYDKDMIEVKRTVTMTGFCSALYGFGKGEEITNKDGEATGGYGRRIDFAAVNDGKAYVENTVARDKYGYIKDGQRQHIFAKVEYDDITDPDILKAETQKELNRRSIPHVTYSCKVVDLRKYGMEFEGVGLGDTVLVVDNDLGIRMSARIMEYTDYPDNERENEITLGNFKKSITSDINATTEYINNFRSRSGVWDRAEAIQAGGIPGSYIDGIVAELNEQANQSGGWVFLEPGGGLISYNASTAAQATEAVQIIGGTVRIANQKNADGTWKWRTFITGSQVVADMMRTGILQGGKVRFNLDDGTWLIGNSATDYQIYWDGSTLKIKGSILVDTINSTNLRLAGKNITLDGNTNVLGTFSVSGDALFGTINAQTIRIKNQDLSEFVRGFLNTPTFSTGFTDYQPATMKGTSVAFGANSQYITINDTGGRAQILVKGTVAAIGGNYYYEMNSGGYYGGTSQGSARVMMATNGASTLLYSGSGAEVLRLNQNYMYYLGYQVGVASDGKLQLVGYS